MSFNIRARFEPLHTVGFASIGATYTAIGNPYEFPVRIWHLQNLTDVILTFSDDGIHDKLVLPPNGFLLLDLTTNKTLDREGFSFAQGDSFYVKQNGVPTSGAVYLTLIYGARS